jgi:hypothetical protein
MVIKIDVALHEFIVTGASFNRTTLPFCMLPKPDPVIST